MWGSSGDASQAGDPGQGSGAHPGGKAQQVRLGLAEPVQDHGATDLTFQAAPHVLVVGECVGRPGGGEGGMECDGHAVATEAGDDAHLVAEPEHVRGIGLLGGVNEAVGHAENGGWLIELLFCFMKAGREMRAGFRQVFDDARP